MTAGSERSLSRLELVYAPLGDYLRDVDPSEDVSFSFAEVERVLGRPLPRQARDNPDWWGPVVRQPQSRVWLRADRRANVDLRAETVTFVWEVFSRNNSLERLQRMRSDWLAYARTSLASPPTDRDHPHVDSGWWEPHEVYLLHLVGLGKYKVGLTRIGSKRIAAVGGASAVVVDRITLANRWAALVVEHHVLELAWSAWEQPDRFASGDRGETERWNDWLVPPPLSVIHDSLEADLLLSGWALSIRRAERD